MTQGANKYSIDTSALVEARRRYPKDIFPQVWEKLGGLIESGRLIASEEVLHELDVQDDDLTDWANKHQQMFIDSNEEIQSEVQKIMSAHKNFVDLKKYKSGADPFVIAVANIKNCIVVSEEKPSGGPHQTKIPDVCSHQGVECIKLLDMLRRES